MRISYKNSQDLLEKKTAFNGWFLTFTMLFVFSIDNNCVPKAGMSNFLYWRFCVAMRQGLLLRCELPKKIRTTPPRSKRVVFHRQQLLPWRLRTHSRCSRCSLLLSWYIWVIENTKLVDNHDLFLKKFKFWRHDFSSIFLRNLIEVGQERRVVRV